MKIAKLNKVELREVWAHEAHDFTKWLCMMLLGQESIRDVILFPQLKPK